MLINRTYMVVRHLGTGTYGQVKLAFNLKDRKLYAIKTCRKSQLGCPSSLNSRHKHLHGRCVVDGAGVLVGRVSKGLQQAARARTGQLW